MARLLSTVGYGAVPNLNPKPKTLDCLWSLKLHVQHSELVLLSPLEGLGGGALYL